MSAMRFDVVTLFPTMFAAITDSGITRRALESGLWQWQAWSPRDYTADAHRTVDDRPFGGGAGMVMMAEPLALAVEAARQAQRTAGHSDGAVVALSASGVRLTDAKVRQWASLRAPLVLVCGRYEGIDQRFLDACVSEEVSIGDFVISGGELAAMALMDAVIRHLPGAMKEASATEESFAEGLLDAPQYTRPEMWRSAAVPPVLLSGHHGEIDKWRRAQQLLRTRERRPDLLDIAKK